MNQQSDQIVSDARDAVNTSPGRCYLYALFSDLTASPFDSEPAVAGQPLDMSELQLPYELPGLADRLEQWQSTDTDVLRREYSALFEVGSDGPPVPIREDLARNQPAGVREEIVRFYEYFNYSLSEKFAWAPDHLSVELEFMHYLTYCESDADHDTEEAVSFQLAQRDFAERHLVNWVPELAARANGQQQDSLYGQLLIALSEFLQKDFQWQQSTLTTG